MIIIRLLMAALVLGVAPRPTNAHDQLPAIGTIPGNWSEYAHALMASQRHREAIAAFERAMETSAEHSDEYAWNIARSYAILGNRKQALRWVERAIDLGFGDCATIRHAPEFAKFRGDPKLDQLLRPLSVSKARVALVTSHF